MVIDPEFAAAAQLFCLQEESNLFILQELLLLQKQFHAEKNKVGVSISNFDQSTNLRFFL
jgi:hypothetical protein